jgi:hypothetical protein
MDLPTRRLRALLATADGKRATGVEYVFLTNQPQEDLR